MIYCIRKFNGGIEKDHKMTQTLKIKNFNEDAFLADVSCIRWDQIAIQSDDINHIVNNWSNLFSLTIN